MPVVSNTSPLLNLAIIGHLSLVHEQFGEIWIPQAVRGELRVEESLPGSHVMHEATEKGWLRIEKVKDQQLVKVLQNDLGACPRIQNSFFEPLYIVAYGIIRYNMMW